MFVSYTIVLQSLGLVTASYFIYNALYLARLYTRSSQLSTYITKGDNKPWAMITGASDGIGAAFANELAKEGFNIFLHGRNKSKLERVRENILKEAPQATIELVVIDAGNADALEGIQHFTQTLQDRRDKIDLRILINNVGGTGGMKPAWATLPERTVEEVDFILNVNARFPTHLTRALLPFIAGPNTTTSTQRKGLILTMGSFTGILPSAYQTIYAGTKAYLSSFSNSLKAEILSQGMSQNVEVLSIMCGPVASSEATRNAGAGEENLYTPGPRRFARAALGCVGCGRDVVTAYWPHLLMQWGLESLPEVVKYWAAATIAKGFKNREIGGNKKR